jgi:hypothetical protein
MKKNDMAASSSTSSSYIEITATSTMSPDYARLTRQLFHPNPNYRVKKHVDEKKIPERKPIILREPACALTAIKYAELIKGGRWCELDLDSDPDFIRNIYKACRLGFISENDLVTAYLLFRAKEQFFDKKSKEKIWIKQYSFGEGPYDPRKIWYATDEKIARFYTELKKLSPHEQCYFSVNFSKKYEIYFLAEVLRHSVELFESQKFKDLLMKCSTHFPQTEKKFLELVEIFCEDDQHNYELYLFILSEWGRVKLEKKSEVGETKDNKRLSNLNDSKTEGSFNFLSYLWDSGEKLPSIIPSPDYDPADPHSPVISFVVLNMSAFSALEHALHGENSCHPCFTLGEIPVRFIRDLDESTGGRPVEISHPDVPYGPFKPHGYLCHRFMHTWHDFFHVWRNGANPHKPMIRYMRKILASGTGFDMSAALWSLSDMGFALGQEKTPDITAVAYNKEVLKSSIIILTEAVPLFWFFPQQHQALLLIIDMIKHRDKWRDFFGKDIGEFFSEDPLSEGFLADHCSARLRDKPRDFFALFHQVMRELEPIVRQWPNMPASYYILAFQFKDDKVVSELLSRVDGVALSKFIQWERNKGLLLNRKSLETEPGETFDIDLLNQLKEVLEKNARTPTSESKVMDNSLTLFRSNVPATANRLINNSTYRSRTSSIFSTFFFTGCEKFSVMRRNPIELFIPRKIGHKISPF